MRASISPARAYRYTASAYRRREVRGTLSHATSCTNSEGQRYALARVEPRSGGSTSRAGLSSRTRSAVTFERHASANIFDARPHTFAAVFQVSSSPATRASRCDTSCSRSRRTTARMTRVPISGST
ncbi:MAG: hypothetical protein WCJ30_02695 [Deltaproteobacteria bacterium]